MNLKAVIVFLTIAILVFPLLVVQIFQTDNPQPYVFKARIIEKLGETQNPIGEKLQYFLVKHIEGNSPATEFIVLIDESHTKGFSNINLERNQESWIQGTLMTRRIYTGERFLFFNRPQIDARQVKNEGFWPDQIKNLRDLYLSPISIVQTLSILPIFLGSTLVNPLSVFDESFLKSLLFQIVTVALIFSTLFLLIKNRHKRLNLLLILLTYTLLAMFSTALLITNLYL